MPTFQNATVDVDSTDLIEALVDDPEIMIDAINTLASEKSNPVDWYHWQRVREVIKPVAEGKVTSLDVITSWAKTFESMEHLDRERAMAELARVQQ